MRSRLNEWTCSSRYSRFISLPVSGWSNVLARQLCVYSRGHQYQSSLHDCKCSTDCLSFFVEEKREKHRPAGDTEPPRSSLLYTIVMVNIRQARPEDLIAMQTCNLACLPEVGKVPACCFRSGRDMQGHLLTRPVSNSTFSFTIRTTNSSITCTTSSHGHSLCLSLKT